MIDNVSFCEYLLKKAGEELKLSPKAFFEDDDKRKFLGYYWLDNELDSFQIKGSYKYVTYWKDFEDLINALDEDIIYERSRSEELSEILKKFITYYSYEDFKNNVNKKPFVKTINIETNLGEDLKSKRDEAYATVSEWLGQDYHRVEDWTDTEILSSKDWGEGLKYIHNNILTKLSDEELIELADRCKNSDEYEDNVSLLQDLGKGINLGETYLEEDVLPIITESKEIDNPFRELRENIDFSKELGWTGEGHRYRVDADTLTNLKKGDKVKVTIPAFDLEYEVKDGSCLDLEAQKDSPYYRDVVLQFEIVDEHKTRYNFVRNIEDTVNNELTKAVNNSDTHYYSGLSGDNLPLTASFEMNDNKRFITKEETNLGEELEEDEIDIDELKASIDKEFEYLDKDKSEDYTREDYGLVLMNICIMYDLDEYENPDLYNAIKDYIYYYDDERLEEYKNKFQKGTNLGEGYRYFEDEKYVENCWDQLKDFYHKLYIDDNDVKNWVYTVYDFGPVKGPYKDIISDIIDYRDNHIGRDINIGE